VKKNRSTLKDYFKKGAIPTEANFADLIDSMLNQDEDNVSKLPNDPLRVTATGADEALLNFYRVEQNEEKLTWQVKQKPGGTPGLSIGDETGSRLFIESGTGKVGVGTSTPNAKLDILSEARSGTHPAAIKGLYVTGSLGPDNTGIEFRHSNGTQGIGFGYNTIYATGSVTDQDLGLKPRGTGKVVVTGPLKVTGATIQVDGNQKIFFSDTDTTNNLKIQLWSGYGLGINGSTLFYAANGQHSWRDSNGTSERMLLTTGADGGLTVRGTGVSSFAGSLGISTSDVGSFKLSVNGDLRANRYVVQDSVDGGATKGIWMWNSSDSNWGIYMSSAGAKKSLAGNVATGGDGFSSHSIRVRTYSDQSNGFIYENHNEQLNFSVRASNGNGYFRGSLSLGNSDIYFTKTDHDHSGFGNTNGYAAIENAKDYDALMILGRAHTGGIRTVKLWDYLEVNGEFVVNAGSRTLKMQGDGNLVIYGGGKALWATGTNSSDARLKKDIRPIENALQKLLSIKGVGFSWVDELMGKGPDIGILAQDVETVFPELVSSLDQKYKSVKYLGLIPVLIEAIREMENHVLDLQTQIQVLKGIE
jgi:hypothetical protein